MFSRDVPASLHVMDETSIEVKGQRYDLCRAVDKTGQTIDFLLTEPRDERAAKRFLTKAIRGHGVPETITIDGSEANAVAIRSYNKRLCCKNRLEGEERLASSRDAANPNSWLMTRFWARTSPLAIP